MSTTSTCPLFAPAFRYFSSVSFNLFRWRFTALAFLLLLSFWCQAQISPPGVSSTQGVSWAALGLSQHLGSRWTSTTYAGVARESDPDNWALLKKQGLLVLNQEVVYGFTPHWQLSVAGSLRRQNEYASDAPYELENPAYRYEARYYSRLYYKHKIRQVAMTYTFRPELRTFFQSSEEPLETPEEIRIRAKAQASIPLNDHHNNFLIGGNEILTAMDENSNKTWSAYHFTEDRLSVYFRHVFPDSPVCLDLGIMEQFKPHGHKTSYLAFDLLLQDPFSKRHAAH
ncbi:DUF2490 domain-containing protein [Rufibacter sediminis]|uniref:DUF2490 domain-containing protein n=1 Tax=Rufibacter sediminis TaxID=2762756 RepID=A0ABR6VVK8_9BACT|nr:DUF2490 domain-containing protein [Rufibacter sediminis]MBC3541248.1 DUF2490 domain-containing protein [Rufibacter sediminis]